jgi:hypothetical protein
MNASTLAPAARTESNPAEGGEDGHAPEDHVLEIDLRPRVLLQADDAGRAGDVFHATSNSTTSNRRWQTASARAWFLAWLSSWRTNSSIKLWKPNSIQSAAAERDGNEP